VRFSKHLASGLWLAVACVAGGQLALAQDVLPPEEAFPYSIEAYGEEIVLDFEIEDGYYLYRERFNFASRTDAVSLGEAILPDGKIYEDEFFGVVETYRGPLQVRIPYESSAPTDSVEFQLGLQGCADIGLCYPPQRWITELALPASVRRPRRSIFPGR